MSSQVVGLCVADPDLRERVSALLTGLGYQVTLSAEGFESPPDLIVADPAFAADSGGRILSVKARTELFLPVVLLLPRGEPFEPWLEAGYDDFLPLPVRREELAAKLRILLGIRRRSEQFALECRHRARAIFETTGAATIIVDENGSILMANRECLRITGYSPEELIGTSWTRYVAPESLDMMLRCHKARREDPESAPTSYVARLINKAGQLRDAMVYVRLIPGTGDSVVTVLDITELRWNEEKIIQLGQRWRQTFDSIQDPVWVADEHFRILQANATAVEFFGDGPAELEGRQCWEVMHGTSGPPPGCPGTRAMASRQREVWQFQENGRIFEIYVDPMLDESGRLTGFIHVMRDITEQVNLHLALTQAEQNFHRTIDESPIGVRIATLDDRTLYANRSYLGLFGYQSLEELRETPPVNLYSPRSYQEYVARQQQRLQGDPGPRDYEIEIVSKDGCPRVLKVHRQPILWDGEQHSQILYQDITEARRAERALRDLSAQLAALNDAIEDSLILISEDYRVIWANRTAAAWAGKEAEAMVGERCYGVLHGLTIPCDPCPARAAFQTGTVQQETFTMAGGRIIEVRAFPIKEDQRVVSVVEVGRDRTEYKRLEAQYIQAQKMEAVGRLAGGLAHDFNNMLSIIQGYAELLDEELPPGSPLASRTGAIIETASRSAGLVEQLLAFSRKQPMQPETLDLNRLLASQEEIWRRMLGEDVTLEIHKAENLWAVRADRSQLMQVILNLVVNAREAMPEGGTLLIETANVVLDEEYARTHPEASPGEHVLLAVSDSGCGMDRETMEKDFEPFFTTKNKGSGLGLATVHGIVKQSGGSIQVYSELGRGTTFKIYLPRTTAVPGEPVQRPARHGVPGRGDMILVVEDEGPLRELLGESLRRLGYRVQMAAGPGEAIRMVESGQVEPDLVLTDVIMPGMNGKAMIDRLRKTSPDLKALFMSGYTENVILHQGAVDPATPFLQKPFRTVDLARKIRELLDN